MSIMTGHQSACDNEKSTIESLKKLSFFSGDGNGKWDAAGWEATGDGKAKKWDGVMDYEVFKNLGHGIINSAQEGFRISLKKLREIIDRE